ncbi:1-deoxy-D-xylulose-5-phosphate synthase N-terminal domain-containing protein [Paenibacillus paeoniae]|uniref:Transketolase n=1 Tax=Paenibacillus paeoniae TaxID=2292705 RepID=A0A371PL81_9BACL|nr:1-deoxy-D-xylulose-5-phosphate synthase N-terminal domain-containing protein [Paenibacillus paeoniae]REK76958.1 transketolase [Paenibacillus paeoniae]
MEQAISVRSKEAIPELLRKAKEARELIIDMAATPTGCHIGGSLSVIDLLIGAFAKRGHDPESLVLLSKGHAAAALYAALYVNGTITDNPAAGYGRAGSLFTGHPNHKLPGIPFATGSLGHGISYGAGWAIAQKLKGTDGISIVIGGDGELQEGLCWETAQIVQAQSLANFIYVVDCNGGQNDGYVQDISPIRNLKERFEAFGFTVREIDGHDFEDIWTALEPDPIRPVAVLAQTVKGKGVPAIEGNPEAHYVKIPEKLARRWKVSLP